MDTIEAIVRAREPVAVRHRIIDTRGCQHAILIVGNQLRSDDRVIGAHGFYVDITLKEADIHEELTEIAENRAVIERAKGMLMLVYCIDAQSAFDVLTWRSQHTNVKVNRPAFDAHLLSWERRRTLRVLRGVGNRVLISPTICGPESTIGGCVSRPTPDLPLVL